MKKAELISKIAGETELPQVTVERVLNAATDALRRDLDENDETTLDGFGKLKATRVAARMGRNPKTGEQIKIPARKRVSFHAGVGLKRAVNS